MVEDEIIASPRPSVVNPQYERLTENLESVKNTSNPGTARQDTLRRLFKFIQTNQRTPGTSAPLENSSDEIQGQTYFMDAQQLQQRAYQLALIRTLFGREHVPTVDICIDMAVANGWLSAAALTKHVVVVSRNVQRHILYEKLMLQTLSTGMKCTNDNTIAGKLATLHRHNGNWKYLLHERSSNFPSVLRAVLTTEMHKLLLDSNCSKQAHETVDKNLGISISVRKDQSAKIILPTLEVHIEPGAVDELVEELGDFESSTGGEETFEEYCSKEELNEQLDSTAAFSCLGYMGDDEGKRNARDRNGNFNKNLRKKFGIYPDYRIRLNGVRWRTLESSDEEDLGEDTLAQDEAYRGSRKSKRGKKRSNVSKSTDCDIISSEDEGDSEESEAVVVHIVAAKKKKMTKRRFQCDEVDTSASEASDVESLTDCSLCCNE